MEYPDGPHTLWLAMSGGGTRAALFHYGALKRLYELHHLPQVISATSGGALVAALLGVHSPITDADDWKDFEQDLLDAAVRGLLGPAAWSVAAGLSVVLAIIVGIVGIVGIVLLPGLDPGPTALALFSVCFTVFALATLTTARQLHLIERNSGTFPVGIHTGRFRNDSEVTTNSRPRITDRFKQWSGKFFLILRPSYARWHTLNFRVFRKSNLSDFDGQRIFLFAVDLNSGDEVIFSEKMLCKLDNEWLHKLWKNYADTDPLFSLGQGKDIPVATAVAASSAYPPFFSSVPVIIKNKLIANCIDGGVIDNNAMAAARLMAKYVINPERYVGGQTFSRTVGRLLALDASRPTGAYRCRFWPRLCTLLRLADVLHHRQAQDFKEAVDDIGRLFNVPARAIALQMEPGDDCALTPEIALLAAGVRTHFDPFSKVECSVLAYLGYYWANQWAIKNYLERKPPKPRSPNDVPMRGIGGILPARFAPPAAMLTDSEILAHLRFSHLRFRPWRWLRRCIARKFPQAAD